MVKRVCFSIAGLAMLALAPSAAAQIPSAMASISAASRGHGGGAFTGMRVGGRPAPAPDGSPRWADFPVVGGVWPGSPAEKVGIAAGDVVLRVNGLDARDPRTLFGRPGKVFTVRVRRGTAIREFVLTSVRAPAPPNGPAHD
jgi:S1-C subfamily serine protease